MEATHIANPVQVRAAQILRVANAQALDHTATDALVIYLDNEREVTLKHEHIARYVPVAGDYFVTQEDGYQYVNPREVFERKYSRITGYVDGGLNPHYEGLHNGETEEQAVERRRVASKSLNGEQQTEQAIQAAGKTAARITPADIDAAIAETHYFTAFDGVYGASITDGVDCGGTPPLSLLTFCVLVLRNGFTVTGESACASFENFDEQIGRDIARKNAREKIWQLEGYLLKERLSHA